MDVFFFAVSAQSESSHVLMKSALSAYVQRNNSSDLVSFVRWRTLDVAPTT